MCWALCEMCGGVSEWVGGGGGGEHGREVFWTNIDRQLIECAQFLLDAPGIFVKIYEGEVANIDGRVVRRLTYLGSGGGYWIRGKEETGDPTRTPPQNHQMESRLTPNPPPSSFPNIPHPPGK